MQRAFSFDNGDDDDDDDDRGNRSSYRPLPLEQHPPPRPPLHQQPLQDYHYRQQQQQQQQDYSHRQHLTHTRHTSVSSLSSTDSSVSSLAAAVGRDGRRGGGGGGLGAPSPRSFHQQHHMYSTQSTSPQWADDPQQQQHHHRIIGGDNNNNSSSGGGGYHTDNADTRRAYSSVAPAPSDRYPGEDTSLHSASPMSQAHVPLMNNGTPASRFADPVPSPPLPPPHHSPAAATTTTTGVGVSPSPHRRVLNDPVGGHYTDNPYTRYSTTWDPQLVARQLQTGDSEALVFSDDDEDHHASAGLGAVGVGAASAAAAAASAGAVTTPAAAAAAATSAGVVGRSANRKIPVGPVGAAPVERGGLLGSSEGGSTMMLNEKAMPSDWMQKQTHSKKKTRWIVIVILVLLVLAAAGGATAGVLLSKKKSSGAGAAADGAGTGVTSGGGGGLTAPQDVAKNGDLNKDSSEIKALMSNSRLHKVFHGMDYTPLNSQYPDCLKNPPSQNNVTRDIAVMSLLTDKLRLYGNDCNQTEMVLHAIDALSISMTVWLGVWLDSNTTTNARQLSHLYTILASYPASHFEGVAVGNEVLFRENLSEQSLFSTIADVRKNLTALSITLPVATSDLGSNWKLSMLPYVDVLMANVHPFFAGVVVEKAADWTWSFFQDNDVVLTKGLTTPVPRVMISEVGWPSEGGAQGGSVAGVSEMNRFLEDFVCAQNQKGTEYFWFSAFDEPWKVVYNTPGKEWEDKWGLMNVNRDLKDGLVIPTCT